ncbi:hypothetical protein LCGC14_2132560 [marine sediment metagenome]|uniref:Uncharacterized protein n=1 Tax=marine sediment metagenome TaxID=412755 RepID=A0A0F9E0X2_9ZZZZ
MLNIEERDKYYQERDEKNVDLVTCGVWAVIFGLQIAMLYGVVKFVAWLVRLVMSAL